MANILNSLSVVAFVRRGSFYAAYTFASLASCQDWAKLRGWALVPIARGWELRDALTRVMGSVEYELLVDPDLEATATSVVS